MKRKTAVIPAIAYSISFSSQPLGGFSEAPHQGKEKNHNSDVEQIQHDSPHLIDGCAPDALAFVYAHECSSITWCPAFIKAPASFSSRVRHQRFLVPRITSDFGSRTWQNPSNQLRAYNTCALPGS